MERSLGEYSALQHQLAGPAARAARRPTVSSNAIGGSGALAAAAVERLRGGSLRVQYPCEASRKEDEEGHMRHPLLKGGGWIDWEDWGDGSVEQLNGQAMQRSDD